MSLRSKGSRPNKRKYEDLDDSRDTRVPLHNDEAFMHGLSFTSKFIGSLEVTKPSSRVEIVSCMRRIRYEFRAKNIKKIKSTINISVSGVKITKYVKKRRRKRKTQEDIVSEPQVILESPIYRIFYVSHDSLDKKIFSFIARVEAAGNRKTFVCAVFKAYKKSHALRVVRTIGQAFDICCKLQQSPDAANIPGLLPPEKAKKLKEKKDGDEGTCVDDTDGSPDRFMSSPGDALQSFNLDVTVFEASELPPNAIVTMDDDYLVALMEYQKHLYSLGQSLLLNSAEMQQATNEESLLEGYNLTVAQRQLMLLQFRIKQEQGLANVFLPPADTQSNLGRQDSIMSKPLPTPPPNRLKISASGRSKFGRPGVGVRENSNRDDSALLGKDGDGSAAADNVPTDLLVDTSIPEGPVTPINPFTDNTLLEDADGPLPKTDAQWLDMQRAQTAQLQLLKDQLSAETAARIDSQAKTHHVMRQNKVLAAYIAHIGARVKRQQSGGSAAATTTAEVTRATGVDGAATGTGDSYFQAGTSVDDPVPARTTPAADSGLITIDDSPRAPAASQQPSSDMELLSEILAASSIQRQRSGDFEPRVGETAADADAAVQGATPEVTGVPADGGRGQGRFSPFTFQQQQQAASANGSSSADVPSQPRSSTPQEETDGRFSPFEGFQPVGATAGTNNTAAAAAAPVKPVVLFELPKAVTPLSDMDDDENPLYQPGAPAYMPLQDGTADSGDDLGH